MNNTHVIKLTPGITNHDISYRIKQCEKWFKDGDRVMLQLTFKGRQMLHPEIGMERIGYVVDQLLPFSVLDGTVRQKGRMLTCILRPKSKKK